MRASAPGRRLAGAVAAALVLLCTVEPLLPEARGSNKAGRHTRHRFRAPGSVTAQGGGAAAVDPPEVTVGERLFLETRFAQFFAAHAGNDVNRPLASGDPVLDTTPTTGAPLPGAFAGKSTNCRSCHFVDDVASFPGGRVSTMAR